jgi:hypothetical protein
LPASLRSDGVRVHPGMPFGFPSEEAFSFAGIPTPTPTQRQEALPCLKLRFDPAQVDTAALRSRSAQAT